MPRGRRALLKRQVSDEEFETPAFKEIDEKQKQTLQSIETSQGETVGDALSDSDTELDVPVQDSDDSVEESDLDNTAPYRGGTASNDDSDEAPDDVGFSETRSKALAQMKEIMKQQKEEKLLLKKRRKEKDEKFKEQKKIKLDAMTRLPEEIINSLSEKVKTPREPNRNLEKKKKKKNKTVIDRKNEEKQQVVVTEETEDYLPLETSFVDRETGIQAMSLKDMKRNMAVSQSAANFKNNRFYGDSRKRESTKAYLAKMERKEVFNHKRR